MGLKLTLSKTGDARPKHLVVVVPTAEHYEVMRLLEAEVTGGKRIERNFLRQTNQVQLRFNISYLEKLMLCVPFATLSEGVEKMLLKTEKARLAAMPVPELDIPGMVNRELWDFQKIMVQKLANEEVELNNDEMGLGKGVVYGTPLLTPNGWRKIEYIHTGDKVIGSDGKPTIVVGVYPQPAQPVYRVTFSDGAWVRTDAAHLWQVSDANGRSCILSTGQMHQAVDTYIYGKMPNGGSRTYRANAGIRLANGDRKWRVPLVEPVHFNPTNLPIKPYVLGVILGDGAISTKGYVSVSKPLDTTALIQLLEQQGAKIPGIGSQGQFSISEVSTELCAMRLNGKRSWEKFVPRGYLQGIPADRLALLQGLMDTDGYAMPDGGAEFSSTSYRLITAVISLTQSLGGVAKCDRNGRYTKYPYNGEMRTGRKSWRVNIKLPSPYNPFRLPRKATQYVVPTKYQPTRLIDSIEPDGVAKTICIKVSAPDELYVTRNYIVTHNTTAILATLSLKQWFPCLVVVGSVAGKWVWEREAALAFPELTVQVVDGTSIQRRKQIKSGADIVIVNAQALRVKRWIDKDTHTIQEEVMNPDLFKIDWECLVVDEYHKFKNPSAQQTVGFLKMGCGHFIGASGPQPLTAKVLTPSGWKSMGDMTPGTDIIGQDGKTYQVTGFFPKGQQEVFEVTSSDYGVTHATANHLWSVNSPGRMQSKLPYRLMTTQQIIDRGLQVCHNWIHFLPIPQPVELSDSGYQPIPPYILGLLLGDGTFRNGITAIANNDQEILDYVAKRLPKSVHLTDKGHSSWNISLRDNQLRGKTNPVTRGVRKLGLAEVEGRYKFIPIAYKTGSIETRLAILQGLLDADGHITHKNAIEFTSISKQLAEDVVFLARSLGGTASMCKSTYEGQFGRENNHPRYRVVLAIAPGLVPFKCSKKVNRWTPQQPRTRSLVRKIKSITSVGVQDVACISTNIPDQLYITDDFIVTHNTPIMNRPEEAWSFMHKVDPELYPTYYNFESKIAVTNKAGHIVGYNPSEMLKLKNWLNTHSLRRRKEHVRDDLPEVIRSDQLVPLTPEQRRLYNQIKNEMILAMDDGELKDITQVRVQIMRLKQACFSPELYGGSPHSGKIDQIKQDVADLVASGEKAIIFSEWARAARILERELAEYNPAYVDGSVPGKNRQAQVDRFNSDPDCHLYIGTIKANQEAITLSAATYVLFADEDWTPAANAQAEARSASGGMRGINVTGSINIIRYQAEDTVEQRLSERLYRKQKTFNAMVERDAGSSLKKMSIRRLRDLL